MKEVKAYIAKHKLGPVTRALHKMEGLTGLSVIECGGYGRGLVALKDEPEFGFHSGVKLEIICHDDLVETLINAIEKAAHTGLKSDGKIYVASIEQAVRISTGERGEGAV
ncbi:MAG: P-II family nitrogen regulator [Verrucomicrobiota bacterium]|nr:P-II family nitrogen regulator [Verrucomicrobiota bacterium]MDD8049783.1 P-II family nitrogen regulator [Verrucomicrobiota bacterium]